MLSPPFGGWRHHLARWEACHWIRGSRGSPMNPVPLPPPQFGGAAKGKRLNGQARCLASPHLEVLCRTSTILYNSRGRSPHPVREASAGPGQNPWRPGPKARRRHQPSPAKAGVNLREYEKAPPKSRSRSRPRHRHPNPQAQTVSGPAGLTLTYLNF